MFEFKLQRVFPLVLVLGIVCCEAYGASVQVSLGQIGISTFVGLSGNNTVFLANNTAADCTTATTFAYVCGGINITNWSVTIDYIQNSLAQSITDTYTSGASTAEGYNPSIAPNNDPITNPLDSSLTPDAVITEVDFTGTVPGSFTICDPNAGCVDSSGEALFSLPSDPWTFTFQYIPGPDYLGSGFDQTDLLVSADNGTGGGGPPPSVPEPASVALMVGGTLALTARKYFVR